MAQKVYLFWPCACNPCGGGGTPGDGDEDEDQDWLGPRPEHPNWWEWYQEFPNGLMGEIPKPELINMIYDGTVDANGNISREDLGKVSWSPAMAGAVQRVQVIIRVPEVDDSDWPETMWYADGVQHFATRWRQYISYRDPFRDPLNVFWRYGPDSRLITPWNRPANEEVSRQDVTLSDGVWLKRHWACRLLTDLNPTEGGILTYYPAGAEVPNWKADIDVNDVVPPGSSIRVRMTMLK